MTSTIKRNKTGLSICIEEPKNNNYGLGHYVYKLKSFYKYNFVFDISIGYYYRIYRNENSKNYDTILPNIFNRYFQIV